jgi:WD40 repeat protein
VIKTYTGEVVFHEFIDPANPTRHTQSVQGISGDGRVIATISNFGLLRAYQLNGTNYIFKWQNQVHNGIGSFYTSIDITYDGNFIAAGTLDFITPDSYEGEVRLFETNGTGNPYWVSEGLGDYVSGLSFSKSGNILSASSWGALDNSKSDLYIFKPFLGSTPVFRLNTQGSLFSCETSNDGTTVVTTGKAIHARIMASGGLNYNVDVDTTDIITSLNIENPAALKQFT